jgi:hypothetical protein
MNDSALGRSVDLRDGCANPGRIRLIPRQSSLLDRMKPAQRASIPRETASSLTSALGGGLCVGHAIKLLA